MKPVVSTAALPQVAHDEPRTRHPPLTRRVSHTESASTAQHARSPRKADKPLQPSAHSSSHMPSPRPTLPRRLSDGGASGTGATGADSPTEPSESSGTEQDEAERKKEEQEDLSRKLKELGRMMTSDTLGFARPPNRTIGRRQESRLTLRGVPERSSADEAPASSTHPQVERGDHDRVSQLSPLSRVSRFAREAIPSIPSSSGSSSPGEPSTTNAPQSGAQEFVLPRHRSLSSQGSEASSFSDISGRQ